MSAQATKDSATPARPTVAAARTPADGGSTGAWTVETSRVVLILYLLFR
jgi:hypothetical protein